MLLFKITAGWTKEIGPFVLRNNGQPVEIPNGATVTLKLRAPTASAFVDTEGDVRVAEDQAGADKGHVFFTPDGEDFKNSDIKPAIYQAKWEVVDVEGKSFFPNGAPDTIEVYPV